MALSGREAEANVAMIHSVISVNLWRWVYQWTRRNRGRTPCLILGSSTKEEGQTQCAEGASYHVESYLRTFLPCCIPDLTGLALVGVSAMLRLCYSRVTRGEKTTRIRCTIALSSHSAVALASISSAATGFPLLLGKKMISRPGIWFEVFIALPLFRGRNTNQSTCFQFVLVRLSCSSSVCQSS